MYGLQEFDAWMYDVLDLLEENDEDEDSELYPEDDALFWKRAFCRKLSPEMAVEQADKELYVWEDY